MGYMAVFFPDKPWSTCVKNMDLNQGGKYWIINRLYFSSMIYEIIDV